MFEIGKEYERTQLLAFVGSKERQRGIIWGSKQPGCVIVTSGGKQTKSAGYEDKRNPDGSWDYFGQGSQGSQDPQKYANKLLVEGQRSVLLFTTREATAEEVRRRGTRSKRYRFHGVFGIRAWEFYMPETGRRAGDQLLLFHLVPVHGGDCGVQMWKDEDGENEVTADIGEKDNQVNFTELRTRLLDRETVPLTAISSTKEYKKASIQIKK
jgi:5-methylcytosine-specific restriction enzyme A